MTPPVAILAGGLATRLRPITETIPKALVPVAGRPFLAHQLELLARNDFRQVVLCVGHLGEQIEAAFGDGANLGMKIEYSYDGERLVGTAGALRRALPKLGEAFLTLYGDSYLDIDYSAAWSAFEASGQPALMTVIENSRGTELSNVEFVAGLVRVYDKKHPTPAMRHIDYGLGVYRCDLFRNLPEGAADLSSLQSSLAREGRLAGYEVTQPYFEIGSPNGLRALESHLKAKAR
jgi:NDP-sugar pyrophosphorylase family protein